MTTWRDSARRAWAALPVVTVSAWAALAVAALPSPSLEALPVFSLSLGLAGVYVGVRHADERRARAFFVLALGATVSPSGLLDYEIRNGRILWGLAAASFSWLGLRGIRADSPLRDFDRRRYRLLSGCVMGTMPATLLGLGQEWALICAAAAGLSLISDGHLAIVLPLLVLGFAKSAPAGAMNQASFYGLVGLSAVGLLWPTRKG
jgi:hypothetical protein